MTTVLLIATIVNTFFSAMIFGFLIGRFWKTKPVISNHASDSDLTDEQLKAFYEADKKQTEAFNATLQSINSFMTGNEPEEVKRQND